MRGNRRWCNDDGFNGVFVPLAAAGLRANKSPREVVEYFEEMVDILMAEEKSKKKAE
ncbi:MAG: hypothetical protein ACP5E4_03130 [Candidatus Aenigmatarchaeota archaeon]